MRRERVWFEAECGCQVVHIGAMIVSCRHKIQLCQALLLLRINSTERLREKLVQLSEEFLTNWLKRNLHFAIDTSSTRLTEFGRVRS